jgi:hypothetical protein
MSTQNITSEYMLLFRNTAWIKGLSTEEIQAVVNRMHAWIDSLKEQGKLKAGQPLTAEGKLISGARGRIVADGPFAESKEAIGGYLLLQVNTLEEAVQIAQDWPALDYGGIAELRLVADECPHAANIREAQEAELANA